MGTKVQFNISLYKGEKISDVAILRHVGIETYRTLKEEAPHLYRNFVECERKENILPDGQEIPYIRPKQFQLDLADLSSEEIKTQILACIYEEKMNTIEENIHEFVRNLKHSSILPTSELKQKEPESTLTLLLFLLIFISILVFLFHNFGFIDKITEPWIY